MADSRVIKRYSNRKLYDTSESRYVTLSVVAELIKDGVDLVIIDNATGEDITTRTLAQVLLEEERTHRNPLNLGAVRDLIKSSGELLHNLDHLRADAGRKVTTLRSEAEKRVAGLKEDAEKRLSHILGASRSPDLAQRLESLEARLEALEALVRKLPKR
jgi:polyhydroxyalkanoate synthesis repressor PhaR